MRVRALWEGYIFFLIELILTLANYRDPHNVLSNVKNRFEGNTEFSCNTQKLNTTLASILLMVIISRHLVVVWLQKITILPNCPRDDGGVDLTEPFFHTLWYLYRPYIHPDFCARYLKQWDFA